MVSPIRSAGKSHDGHAQRQLGEKLPIIDLPIRYLALYIKGTLYFDLPSAYVDLLKRVSDSAVEERVF
jgi:hypothetical protein